MHIKSLQNLNDKKTQTLIFSFKKLHPAVNIEYKSEQNYKNQNYVRFFQGTLGKHIGHCSKHQYYHHQKHKAHPHQSI